MQNQQSEQADFMKKLREKKLKQLGKVGAGGPPIKETEGTMAVVEEGANMASIPDNTSDDFVGLNIDA